jgi:RsiW-degrading membrane proteinase PrsW (M82 family)
MTSQIILTLITTLFAGVGWFVFIRNFDRAEPEPLKEIIRVGILGGAMSAVLSLLFNDLFIGLTGIKPDGSLPLVPALILAMFVGLNEEFWKMTSTRMLIWKSPEFNEPVDALVYGLTVALCFATIENLIYLAQYGPGTIIRGIISTPAHMGFAALWAQGFAVAKFKKGAAKPFRVVLPYLLLAACGHAFYDFLSFTKVAAFLSIVLMVGLIIWTTRRLKQMEGESPFVAPGECPDCHLQNGPKARFCARCGFTFTHEFTCSCPSCSSRVPPSSKYCGACGSAITN